MLRGWGGNDLLETYDAERKPAGWRNVNAAADNFQRLITEMDFSQVNDAKASGDQARRVLGAQLKEATRREWEVTGVALGYRYENSPICVADGTPPTPDDSITYVPTARPGHRAPHAYLPDGRSTLDLFGRGYVLLDFGADAGDVDSLDRAARSQRVPLAVIPIADGKIAELYERKLVLVRPDGHVAWRADELERNPHQLIDIVRGAGKSLGATMPAATKEARRAGA